MCPSYITVNREVGADGSFEKAPPPTMPRKNKGKKTKTKSKTKTPPFPTSFPPTTPVEPKDDLRDVLGRLSVANLLSAASLPSTPLVEPKTTVTNDVLGEDDLRDILGRLSVAELLRAALTCHRWRRVASRCLPRSAPLLGHFFHPTDPSLPPPEPFCKHIHTPAVFAPLDAFSPRLSLDFAVDADRFVLLDCHQGLLLLEQDIELPDGIFPRFLVLDPATRRRALLPPVAARSSQRRSSWHYVGSALLSRAHPSRLCFEAVCFAIDGGHPRAWVASFNDGKCIWRALPPVLDIRIDFDPWWFEGSCVHAAGKIYWHICNSIRLLALDPATLLFSYMLVPDTLAEHCTFRVGETPEDGRLCILAVSHKGTQLQLWVRSKARRSDNGWLLERDIMDMDVVYDAVPGLPKDDQLQRHVRVWPGGLDPGRTGKAFIRTWGYGRYSLHLETGKMERLATRRGKDYGHPMFAYFLAWPPAFLAPEH
ncbi:unnamed protein product [Alopecurus aequalis]